jgi:hypothetical protein
MTCSQDSIDSASHKLRGVRLELSECLVVLREEDVGHAKMVMALSFIQLALDALVGFQSERDTARQL